MEYFLLALTVNIVTLPGLFLRYLPFREFLLPKQKKQIALAYGICFVLLVCHSCYLLYNHGPSIQFYKFVLMTYWLPYILINMVLIPHHVEHHIFIAGMQCMYVMILHGAAIFLIVELVPKFSIVQFCYYQTGIFLLIFAATYPLIKNFFTKIFFAREAINDHSYWRSACLVPILVTADIIYLSYSNTLMATELLVPRILLLISFITLIYAFSYDIRSLEYRAKLNEDNKLLGIQLNTLKDYAHLTESANQKMAIVRHDIRHYNRLLTELIQEKEYSAALRLITKSDEEMGRTVMQPFCPSPIVNAAISIFASKAEQEKIPFTHKIVLPTLLHIDENELAMLISNLLENSLQASEKQPQNQRSISITAKTENNQFILAVANQYHGVVPLNEDGLPFNTKPDHGLGSRSLAAFKEKYKATVICTHQDNIFKIMIYATPE
jgi:signal transduction histidine kinase